jgi:hypothetical protein
MDAGPFREVSLPATLELTDARGMWEWIAAVARGEAARLVVPPRAAGTPSLSALAATLRTVANALELSAVVPAAQGSGSALAKAIREPIVQAALDRNARLCRACGSLWSVKDHTAELERLELNVGKCPACGAAYGVEDAASAASELVLEGEPSAHERGNRPGPAPASSDGAPRQPAIVYQDGQPVVSLDHALANPRPQPPKPLGWF